jgi:hypothetical protein
MTLSRAMARWGKPACPQWFSLQNAEEAKPPPPSPVAAPIIALGASQS